MAASHPAAIAGVKSCAGMKGRAKGRVRRVGGVSWGLWGKQGGGREGGGKVERGGGGGGRGGRRQAVGKSSEHVCGRV